MEWGIALLFVVLVPIVSSFVANSTYPSLARCNKNIISLIKAFQVQSGGLTNTLDPFEKTFADGPYSVMHTSYNYMNDGNKCIYVQTLNGHLNVTFVPRNRGPLGILSYRTVLRDDGALLGYRVDNDAPEFRWTMYTMARTKGIQAYYICNEEQVAGSDELPMGVISVSLNSFAHSHSIRTVVSSLYNTMKNEMGFDFRYNYGEECFLNYRSNVTPKTHGSES